MLSGYSGETESLHGTLPSLPVSVTGGGSVGLVTDSARRFKNKLTLRTLAWILCQRG